MKNDRRRGDVGPADNDDHTDHGSGDDSATDDRAFHDGAGADHHNPGGTGTSVVPIR